MFFRNTLRKKALKHAAQQRSVSFRSFPMAAKVAFCFSYNEDGIEQSVLSFIEFLRNNNISFSGIGTAVGKTKKQIIHLDENISIIRKFDCNFYGLPAHHKTSKLFVNSFDIFVDFNCQESFLQEYIALKTQSVFKIGRIVTEHTPYDLVLEQGEGGGSSSAYLNQLFHYMDKIKPA